MYKVMIVDDEDIIVSGLVKVMPWAKYGCEVAATASDGLAAQAVLRESDRISCSRISACRARTGLRCWRLYAASSQTCR